MLLSFYSEKTSGKTELIMRPWGLIHSLRVGRIHSQTVLRIIQTMTLVTLGAEFSSPVLVLTRGLCRTRLPVVVAAVFVELDLMAALTDKIIGDFHET